MLLLSEHFDVNNVAPAIFFKNYLADRMHLRSSDTNSLFGYSESSNIIQISGKHICFHLATSKLFCADFKWGFAFRTHQTAGSPSSYHRFPGQNFSKSKKIMILRILDFIQPTVRTFDNSFRHQQCLIKNAAPSVATTSSCFPTL